MRTPSMLSWPVRFQRNTFIVELFAKGKTLREIAAQVGITQAAVHVILSEVGLSGTRPCGRRPKDLMKTLKQLEANYHCVMSALGKGNGQNEKR